MLPRFSAAAICWAGALALASCTTGSESRSGLLVAASISPLESLVEDVAGAQTEVNGLIPEGIDSHAYQPAPSLGRILSRADRVFVNGLNLEAPLIRLATAIARDEARVVELAETVEPRDWIYDQSFPRSKGDPNPHLWMNPQYALRFAGLIRDELSDVLPSRSEEYRANLGRLSARINRLDRAIRDATSSVPTGARRLLTYHDSFPYFAREYGWRVIGAVQPADFSEPRAREVARLINQIRREGIGAVFGSEVFPSRVLKRIAKEGGAVYVDELRDDDLPGGPRDQGHDYVGLMKVNMITIVEALGGNAAPLRSVR